MQTIEELNKYNDSGRMLSKEQIVAEYNARYKAEPTPFTHPELFDPLNPPLGYEYDAWHAIWWKPPTEYQYHAQMMFVIACCVLLAIWIGVIYAR